MHVADLAQRMRDRGHRVVVYCSPSSRLDADLRNQDLPVMAFAPHSYLDLSGILSLRHSLTKSPVQIVHVHYSKDLWTLIPAVQLLPIERRPAIVLTKHIGTQKSKSDPLHTWLYSHVDQVIAISRVIRDNILATHPLRPDKVCLIHHGIDVENYLPNPGVRNRMRSELGVAESELLIGIVGRLQIGKGHLEFLHMAQSLAPEFDNLRFVVIGEPTRGEEFRARPILEQVNRLNLGDRLMVLGFRADVPELLSAMDLFVFPSHAEAFGLVLIEAMAAGLAVVSSRCDGVLDIVREGENGLLVPPRDGDALAAAVRQLVLDPQRRLSMGEGGKLLVQQQFAAKRMVDHIEELYRDCLAARLR
ncbi:glycosyltransferase family 4 protein [candidate division KSB1 bacterium]|nr:glycosyltransferase family 4 protein [candidate division KSB1 bacterium]